MNVKNNKRRRKSRESIENVFIELLEEKDIRHISVSEICKKAAINRSTFYSNYIDIFDLADQIFQELNKQLGSKFSHNNEASDITDNTAEFFAFVKDNQKLFKTFFILGYEDKIEITYYNKQLAEKFFGNRYVDYHIEFFRYGFSAILKKWLYTGCQETPQEMAEIIRSEYQGRITK